MLVRATHLRFAAVLLAAALALVGCQRKAAPTGGEAAKHVDVEWLKQALLTDTLSHWLAVSPADNGFFQVALDRQWRPARRREVTLFSQAMMVHVMVAGYEAAGDKACLDAAKRGADFLMGNFRDGAYGGWYWAVLNNGTPFDAEKHCIGQAAAVVALADIYRATGDQDARQAAVETLALIGERFRGKQGGFAARANRDFGVVGGAGSSAPAMHVLAAALALHDATGESAALDQVKRVAEFVVSRLYDAKGGYIAETYDDNWRPALAANGGRVDLGRQFQWAYLFSRAAEKGLDRKYIEVGNRLIDFALQDGYDESAGGVWSFADYGGHVARHDPKAAWRQCQMLRALVRYARRHGRSDLWTPAAKTVELLREGFVDDEFGGLFAEYDPDAYPPAGRRADKGGLNKLPDHEMGLLMEVLSKTRNSKSEIRNKHE